MTGKRAAGVLVIVCLGLTVLEVTKLITPIVTGVVFALALVILGVLSGGFRSK
jgi:hypothetical protein